MRYEREVRLRLIGDKVECQKYIQRARTILGELYNRDDLIGGLEQAWRQVTLPNGVRITVHTNSYMPVITIDATPRPPPALPTSRYSLRLAWIPEGIIMTPVSEEAPDGWGLPTRTAAITSTSPTEELAAGTIINPPYADITDPLELEELLANAETILASPFGTKGGILPQVLLNKYANNKYLDEKEYISGLATDVSDSIVPTNPRRREDYSTPYVTSGYSFVAHWQSGYDPLSCPPPPEDDGTLYWQTAGLQAPQVPGVYSLVVSGLDEGVILTMTLIQPQFSDRLYTNAIFEVPAEDQWYCHRPEELLYGLNAYEGCFQETNRIRADVGEPPFYRQLRGIPSLARMAVEGVALSNKMYHDSDDFRPGYRNVGSRALNATGRSGIGENLLIQNTFIIGSEQSGRDLAIAWENSPPHYANQINAAWGDPDFLGAEHHVAHMGATVDDTLYQGEIDPVTGECASQVFTKKEFWLPPASNHNETEYGLAGVFNRQQRQARELTLSNPFVVFMGKNYYIPELDTNPDFLSLLGAAPYKYTDPLTGIDELYLRAVVVIGDPDLLDETNGSVTIKVITRNVRSFDEYNCEWDEEYSYTFFNSVGWFPYPQSSVEFSPDGTKFLFSMLRTTHEYNEALDQFATDFDTDISATVQPRKTMLVHFVEYRSDIPEIVITPVSAPLVLVNASTTDAGGPNHENIYERSLNSSTPVFAAYDAQGEVQFVYAEVQEYSYQRWKKASGAETEPETESYGYRYRVLRFPSGKKVPYYQMYMQDSETLEDLAALSAYAWPGDYTQKSFTRRIAHIDVITEDIVYHHLVWKATLDSSDAIFETVRNDGTDWLEIDLGYNDPLTGQERYTQILWEGTPKLWAYQQNVRLDGYTHVDSSNRPRTTHDYPMHVSIETPRGIYCQDQAPQSWWANVPGVGWFYYRQVFPTPYAVFEDPENGQGDPSIAMYKATTPMDTLYGRPPASNYYASVAPGLSGYTGGDNTYGIWNPAVWGSLQTANIAPQMANDENTLCKIVRYEDRIVVRVQTVALPYAIPPTTQSTWAGVLAAYNDVPEELAVVIYTNFDLDEAVGMVNVTDIYPFGRA